MQLSRHIKYRLQGLVINITFCANWNSNKTNQLMNSFYVWRNKVKMWITDLTKEVKQQVELKTCSNKLWGYSVQNPEKSVSELLTIAKSFEVMKAYKNDVEKSGGHTVNTLNGTPRRSGKNGNVNRIGMSNKNKTCFRCGGVYSVAIYRTTWRTFNPKLEI